MLFMLSARIVRYSLSMLSTHYVPLAGLLWVGVAGRDIFTAAS